MSCRFLLQLIIGLSPYLLFFYCDLGEYKHSTEQALYRTVPYLHSIFFFFLQNEPIFIKKSKKIIIYRIHSHFDSMTIVYVHVCYLKSQDILQRVNFTLPYRIILYFCTTFTYFSSCELHISQTKS